MRIRPTFLVVAGNTAAGYLAYRAGGPDVGMAVFVGIAVLAMTIENAANKIIEAIQNK